MKKGGLTQAAGAIGMLIGLFLFYDSFLQSGGNSWVSEQAQYQKVETWLTLEESLPDTQQVENPLLGVANNFLNLELEMPLHYVQTYQQALQEIDTDVTLLNYPKTASYKGQSTPLITFRRFAQFMAAENNSFIVVNDQSEFDLSGPAGQTEKNWLELQKRWLKEILSKSSPDYIVLLVDPQQQISDKQFLSTAIAELLHVSRELRPQTKTLLQFTPQENLTLLLQTMLRNPDLDGVGFSFFDVDQAPALTNLTREIQKAGKEAWILATWNGTKSRLGRDEQDGRWLQATLRLAQRNRMTGMIIRYPENLFQYGQRLASPRQLDQFLKKLREKARSPLYPIWSSLQEID